MTDSGSVSAPACHFTPSALPASLQPAEMLLPCVAALVPPTHHVFPSAVVPITRPSIHVLRFFPPSIRSAESAVHTAAHSNEQSGKLV